MSNIDFLMDVLFPATRQRVLALLLLAPGEAFHLREIARRTGGHAGTVGRELEKLVAGGLLLRNRQGNQVVYQANRECPFFDELASMYRKSRGVAAALREALAAVGDKIHLALVFGSFAKGNPSRGSDIDLLVLGTIDFASLVLALHPLQESLSREINPVLYSVEEFQQRLRRGDGFLHNVTNQPVVFVKGDAHDLAELAEDPAPAPTPGRRAGGAKTARRRPTKPG